MCSQFQRDRLTKLELLIPAYEDALQAFADSNIQSYTLDTGQSKQVVERGDIKNMNSVLEGLINRHAVLYARCNGGAAGVMRPQW